MDFIKINVLPNNKPLNVDIPEKDSNSWLIKREDSLRPEREAYVLAEFKKTYPQIMVNKAEQVYKICARSSAATVWLAGVNAKYVQIVKIPSYAKDMLSVNEIQKCSDELASINAKNAAKAKAIKEASDVFKATLENIENSDAYKTDTEVSKLTKIMALNTSDLPLTLQMKIENFTPAQNNAFPDMHAYAREMLYQYKKSLIKAYKDYGDTLDLDKLIEENRLK